MMNSEFVLLNYPNARLFYSSGGVLPFNGLNIFSYNGNLVADILSHVGHCTNFSCRHTPVLL
jgi:hypothetical protein